MLLPIAVFMVLTGAAMSPGQPIPNAFAQQNADSSTQSAYPPDLPLAPALANEIPAERPFSFFDYSQIGSLGVSLSYLYYNEDIDLSDDINAFNSRYGHDPKISGAPKSTEYGAVFGLSGSMTNYNWINRLVLRPKAGIFAGIDNTYDGSLQGQPAIGSAGDTIGMEFYPHRFKKNNVFLFAGCDVGYAYPSFVIPCFLYTGLDFKLWYRDLMNSQGNLYFSFEMNNWETYYWFSLPLGIFFSRPLGARFVAGADASVNLMFYGGMKVGLSYGSGDATGEYPPVTLGNRTSVKVELFVQDKNSSGPSIRFVPYFLYYAFGKSNSETVKSRNDGAQQVFYEPSSNSFLFGFTVSWVFLGTKVK
jgi:hypothetical protein